MGKSYIVHIVQNIASCSNCYLIDVTDYSDSEVFDTMCNLSPTKQVMYVTGQNKYVSCSSHYAHQSVFDVHYDSKAGGYHEFFVRYVD